MLAGYSDQIVSISVPRQGPFGIQLQKTASGFAAEVLNWERVDGKYGPIKRSGKVKLGDILCAINDTPLDQVRFEEVQRMLANPSLDKRVLRFLPRDLYMTEKYVYFFLSSFIFSSFF